jgi:hypothetical protein
MNGEFVGTEGVPFRQKKAALRDKDTCVAYVFNKSPAAGMTLNFGVFPLPGAIYCAPTNTTSDWRIGSLCASKKETINLFIELVGN